jgi:opacity protein-like surface antigen
MSSRDGRRVESRSALPYLTARLGPVIGAASGAAITSDGAFAGDRTRASIGGLLGAGVDFHLGHHWALGVEAGYRSMADFSDRIGARDNYSGFQVRPQ